MARACVVGVDLGGTNVRAQAYFHDGIAAGEKFAAPSRAQEGVSALVGAVGNVVRQALDSAEGPVWGVGLAVAGHVDDEAGLVRWAPNFGETRGGEFHIWRDVPLKELLFAELGLPVVMGNDANLAALAEYRFGSGKGSARCLVLITLGTGVGGGVVLSPPAVQGDARGPLLLLGGNKGGAELGHVCIDPGGPDLGPVAYGALEAYCGAKAIVNRARHKLRAGAQSSLASTAPDELTPRHVSEAAAMGDRLALEVWEEVGRYLGAAVGGFINVFAPDVVAIGGQVAQVGDPLLKPLRRAARQVAIPTLFADTNIVQAERVHDAGTLGGAALALESMQWNETTT